MRAARARAHEAVARARAGLFVAHALWLQCVAEDACIYLPLRAQCRGRHGFVWNPGSPPVEGFTNFLWVAISAAAYAWVSISRLPRRRVGLGSAMATLLVCWQLRAWRAGRERGRRAVDDGDARGRRTVAAWATSGMETTFFTLWVTTAVYCADRFARTATAGAALAVAVALFGATLTRPEGFGIAAIVLGLLGVLSWRDERRAMAPAALMARRSTLRPSSSTSRGGIARSATRCRTRSTRRPAAGCAGPGAAPSTSAISRSISCCRGCPGVSSRRGAPPKSGALRGPARSPGWFVMASRSPGGIIAVRGGGRIYRLRRARVAAITWRCTGSWFRCCRCSTSYSAPASSRRWTVSRSPARVAPCWR